MVRIALTLMLLLALAAAAVAYDQLYTGDSAQVAEEPSFGIEGTFLYMTANSEFDADGQTVDWPDGTDYVGKWIPMKIRYVPARGLEIGASPIFLMETRNFASVTSEYTGTGIGDTWAWVKYNVSLDPILSARLGAKLPTGNDEVLPSEYELVLGTGQTDIDASLMVGLPAGKGLLNLALGYRIRLERNASGTSSRVDELQDKEKPGDEIHFFIGYDHEITDALSFGLGADGYFGAEPTIDGELISIGGGSTKPASSVVYVNPGVDYTLSSGVTVGLEVHYPLMGASVHRNWGFGVSAGFNS
jgi:opacity protein-like surface antigen